MTDICLIRNIPFPIAVSTCPFAARRIANGGLVGLESCTFVNNPLCLSWNKTCDAPVSTIKSWGAGWALFAIKASELGLGLRLGAAGLFQKVFPPNSLLGFRFAERPLTVMVLSSCLSVLDAAISGQDAFGLGFPCRSKSLLGLPLRSPSGFGGQHSV